MFEDLARILGHTYVAGKSATAASRTSGRRRVEISAAPDEDPLLAADGEAAGPDPEFDVHLPRGEFVVVRDQLRCDGSFVLHYYLHLFLGHQAPTALIACAHPLAHYQAVAKKSPLKFDRLAKRGVLRYIDASQLLVSPDALSEEKAAHRLLYKEVIALFAGECSTWPRCVLIDDASMLVNLSNERGSQVLEFLQYLQTACSRHDCTLVVLVHGDAEEDTAVLTAISRLGDLTIFVDPLRRGRSQEVHGQLTLRQREIPRLANTTAPTASLLHFRLTDRTVHVFLPGSK